MKIIVNKLVSYIYKMYICISNNANNFKTTNYDNSNNKQIKKLKHQRRR